MADRTTFQKNLDDRTFRIRLRNTPQEIDISKNKNFVKVIEHEYACRYLEKLNIEPNLKNIQFILKKYPIKNCDIKSEWNNNNFSADTIVISTRKKEDMNQKYQESQTNLFEELGLKLMKIPNIDIGNDSSKDVKGTISNNNNNNNQSDNNNDKQQYQSLSGKKKNQQIQSIMNQSSKETFKKLEDRSNEYDINYDIEHIKKNYIFPFNQTTLRKINQNMQENPKYITTVEEKDLVFTNHIFKYPFSCICIDAEDLQELQKPINITIDEILHILDQFNSNFKREYFPLSSSSNNNNNNINNSSLNINANNNNNNNQINNNNNNNTNNNINNNNINNNINNNNNIINNNSNEQGIKNQYYQQDQNIPKEFKMYDFDSLMEDKNEKIEYNKKRKEKEYMQRAITFDKNQIESVFSIITSLSMAKFIGLFSHFSYWNIFAEINLKTIDSVKKKQIFVQMQEHLAALKSKITNFKLWLNLGMPMVFLTLKMVTEYIFKMRYPTFFKEQGRSLNNQGMIAIDKIFFLCDKVFDETQISGRFTFWESDFKAQTKINSVQNDRKLLKKRIYATSQNMTFLMENPRSSQARNILAKSNKLNPIGIVKQEQKVRSMLYSGDLDPIKEEEKVKLEQINKQRITNLVINKINSKTKSLY